MTESREFMAYLNGWLVPQSQAMAKISEADVRLSGGFYDAERTFNGKIFKLREHLRRLYHGIKYTNLDPGITIEKMEDATNEVIEADRAMFGEDVDYLVSQVVVRSTVANGTNVAIYCQPLDFTSFAWSYARGVRVITPVTYSVPAKTNVNGVEQETYALLTDDEGNVTECRHANFFFIKNGKLRLPDRKKVLPGISMETALEIAKDLRISVEEGDYCATDIYVADEAFITGTRFCILPVATLNGLTITDNVPGPVTKAITDAWSARVGVDFVKQALNHVPTEDTQVIVTRTQ
ncbi:MAG: hypothetical protein FJ319_14010 [SAR202 cluster bacterium]|nr:hypothetical protein [SAR202 cluster bacterium]